MDRCVCCGAYTAEGSMICVNCQRKLKEKSLPKKPDKVKHKEKRNSDD